MENLRCDEAFLQNSPPLADNPFASYTPAMVCRAYKDPVLLEDNRVFQNMLDVEEFYMAATDYFQQRQAEIKPHMRKIVTDWMLEVCLDQNCHADVFLLSCNMMDRFLSELGIKKGQFQLVAAATIFIASKLADPCPVTAKDLVKYTDNTYCVMEILEMEMLILSKLKWDLSAVTPYDFLEHLLRLLVGGGTIIKSDLLRRHTENFIILCATEFRFCTYPPSLVSSAAIAAAAQGLVDWQDHDCHLEDLIAKLGIITRVQNDCLSECIQQIEETFRAAAENVNNQLHNENTQLQTSSIAKNNNKDNSTSQKVSISGIDNKNCLSSDRPSSSSTTHINSAAMDKKNNLSENEISLISNENKSENICSLREQQSKSCETNAHTPTEVFDVAWMCVA